MKNFQKRLPRILLGVFLVLMALILVNLIVTTLIVQTSGSPDFMPTTVEMHPAPAESEFFTQEKQSLPDYFRSEEQTVLTIPEWYLVYNPLEYADFLAAGNHPSDFPFYQSIDEYWSLYDKSVITSVGVSFHPSPRVGNTEAY